MGKRALTAAVGVLAVALVGPVSWAGAKPMDPVNQDWSDLAATLAIVGDDGLSEGPARVAQAFIDENAYYGSTLQASSGSMDEGGSQEYLGRCEGVDVEPCTSATILYVSVMLPHCTPSRTTDCIEGIYVRKDGVVEDGAFAQEWDGQDSYTFGSIPTSMGPTPASGKLPLYSLESTPHSGGSLYAASLQLDFALTRAGDGWRARVADLAAQILPVSVGPRDWEAPECVNVGTTGRDGSSCLRTRYLLPDEAMGMRARVSAKFGQWIFGRIIDPRIELTESGEQVILDVEGRPSVVPQALGILPVEDLPPSEIYGQPHEKGTLLTSFAAGQWGSLDRWSVWNPVVASTAAALKRLWLFRSEDTSSSLLARCVNPGDVAGWISTNAMVYEAQPPEYDASIGALDFKIGGPAFQPDGSSLVSAEYDLLLRSDVARCVWAGQEIVKVATVSVIGGGDGEEVTTTSVGESGGWVRFVARNVFFPEPSGTRARTGAANPTVRVVIPPASPDKPRAFKSCKAMWKKYKDGVSALGAINTVTIKGKKVERPARGTPYVSDALYAANKKLDKDRDRLVCEREPKVK